MPVPVLLYINAVFDRQSGAAELPTLKEIMLLALDVTRGLLWQRPGDALCYRSNLCRCYRFYYMHLGW
jgi:hypothetical protein